MIGEPTDSPTSAAILGLDNVRLDLPLAGLGSRTLAAVLDYLLLVALMGLWWTGGIVTFGFFEESGGWMWATLLVGSFLLQWGYFAVLEIAMNGQTPGKNAMGLRVVSQQGGRPSHGALLMRNLVRAVDVLLALPVMAVDRRWRRLGDMAAGTLVIHQQPPRDDEEIRLGRIPPSWGAREIVVAESLIRRAPRMEPERAQEMAAKLLRWIARQEREFVAAAGESEDLEAGAPGGDRVALLARLLEAEAG